MGNTGSQLIGGFVTVAMGVIVVAAIYQLGVNSSNVATDVTQVANNTLGGLFK